MISSLFIKDYALINEINIDFRKGLNIITGETGAGKSIIIGALGLLLGERASVEIIRKGSAKAIVEGNFFVQDNKRIKKLLADNELDTAPEMIIRREISEKGNNRCFINDTPVTLNLIKEAGDMLVDLHGQHEHQSLLRQETHIQVIDEASDYNDLIENYRNFFAELTNSENKLKEMLLKENSLKEKKDLYQFQLKEINSVDPLNQEDEHLEKELLILENSEKMLALTSELYSILYENDGAIHDQMVGVLSKLNELARIDSDFNEKSEEFNSALALINDVAEHLRSYRDKIDLDPARVETVRERLGAITLLKKKYGGSIETILEKKKILQEEIELSESYSEKLEELEKEIRVLKEKAGSAANEITKRRSLSAKKICGQVVEELKNIGIPDSSFEARMNRENAEYSDSGSLLIENKIYKGFNNGADILEFYISANKGEDLKPLSKVASGGEISRIMLSLKTVLAKNEKLPLLIFDEIDTGISGRIAQKVGAALKSLASYHQIIAITHLPQIAAMADTHYSVEKNYENERVTSKIQRLSNEESLKEVAKLISGEDVTEESIKTARQLIG
ncbi:MAG: DNA repair protein RecN [Ignavibacteria bacterium]|nr:DNA repair protein RecN [Ignavibacteria bacterium]